MFKTCLPYHYLGAHGSCDQETFGHCQHSRILTLCAICHMQEKFQHETSLGPTRAELNCADSPREEPPTWPGRSGVALLTAPLGWVKQASRVCHLYP